MQRTNHENTKKDGLRQIMKLLFVENWSIDSIIVCDKSRDVRVIFSKYKMEDIGMQHGYETVFSKNVEKR